MSAATTSPGLPSAEPSCWQLAKLIVGNRKAPSDFAFLELAILPVPMAVAAHSCGARLTDTVAEALMLASY